MNQRKMYYKLEWKRIFAIFPQILLGTVALSLGIAAIVFCAARFIYANEPVTRVRIAYNMKDDSVVTTFVLNSMINSPSLTAFFKCVEGSEEECEELLNRGEVVASVYVPDHFFYNLNNGPITPIEIHFPKHLDYMSLMFAQRIPGAQLLMDTAISSSSVLYDYYKKEGLLEAHRDDLQELDTMNLSKAFDWDNSFRYIELHASGQMNQILFYICSGLCISMLLLGCTFVKTIKANSRALNEKLIRSGIRPVDLVAGKWSAVSFVYLCLSSFAVTVLFLVDFKTNLFHLKFGLETVINIVMFCILTSVVTLFLISLSGSHSGSIFTLFIGSILMAFICGCLIPEIFLPDIFHKFANYLPVTYMMKILSDLMNKELSGRNLIMSVLLSLMMYFATVMIIQRRKGW